jgi:SAM-dependent methyltransferase
MASRTEIQPPEGFDWKHWVGRWDRMQEGYLVRRAERFATLIRMVCDTRKTVSRIVDLGCGPGSLMLSTLEAIPNAEIWGIDFDPTMLLLARERLARYGGRVHLMLADLRTSSWTGGLPTPVDAVVSATALHWLEPEQLAALYRRIAQALRPGGIFCNADHVGSDDPSIQESWERHRQHMRVQVRDTLADDWDGFWAAYASALGMDDLRVSQRIEGGWEGGVEEGLPLAWHLDRLRECGFHSVDCFWRCDCDAIYGGILGEQLE